MLWCSWYDIWLPQTNTHFSPVDSPSLCVALPLSGRYVSQGDGCSHSSWQYQRWGWYSTFNTALIARQSHSKDKQLCSECTRMCDCKPGSTRWANLSLWTMVKNVTLFGQVMWSIWPRCLLPSQSTTLEDWKNKGEQNEIFAAVSRGISADCTMI